MTQSKSPLAYPIFRALWLAGIASFLGTFVQHVAEAWVMLDLTQSPLMVSLITTVFVTSSLVVMLPAGLLADRYDKRSVLLVSQIVQAIAALGMAALAHTKHLTPLGLLVGAGVLGAGSALGVPAWGALNPEVLPKTLVAEAVAYNAVAFNIARAVGPAIGGLVLDRFGATASFLANAASFFVVMIPLVWFRNAPLPGREIDDSPPSALRQSLAEPLDTVRATTDLRSIFLAMFLFSLGAGMFYALTPAFGRNTLHATARDYGLMIGAMGAGAVLGASFLKRLRPHTTPRVLITCTMLLFATCALATAQVGSIEGAMILLVPAGAGWIGSFSQIAALNQVWAPARVRARVVALYQVGHLGTWAIAAALGGAIAERTTPPFAMTVGACMCFVAAASTYRVGLPPTFTGELS